jgi:hypothetical protein
MDILTDPLVALSPLEIPEDAVGLVPQPSRDEALLHTPERATAPGTPQPEDRIHHRHITTGERVAQGRTLDQNAPTAVTVAVAVAELPPSMITALTW